MNRRLFLRDYLNHLDQQTRTEPPAVTRKDIETLTRKHLGPTWGRKRRPRKP